MTVGYGDRVTDTGIMSFVWLFFRWKGSVWKAVYKELMLWLIFYYALNLPYRFMMSESSRRVFERVSVFFYEHSDFIPLTFMLGFFVNLVVIRWWSMWENIGWIDTPGLYISTYLSGADERSRMYRRSIIRYLLFFQVLVFRDICTPIRDRFPTLETFVPAGYLTSSELGEYLGVETSFKNYYTPIRWDVVYHPVKVMNLIKQARAEGKILSDHGMQDLLERIINYRLQLATLLSYDFQPIPLLYTVVVCLTVRLYFVIALLGRQILVANAPEEEKAIDLYVPWMTIIQFLFFMGWMKVAEALLNPFGVDDDDFECNWLIDRNFEVGFILADQVKDMKLEKDRNWNNKYPEPLYSLDTVDAPIKPLIGSAARRDSDRRPRNQPNPKHKQSAANAWSHPSSLERIDVIMVPRPTVNSNEESLSRCAERDTTVHVRSRRPSAPPVMLFGDSRTLGTGLLNEVKRKLSRLSNGESNSSEAPVDPEMCLNREDDFTFVRRSTRKRRIGAGEPTRRHPSTITEEIEGASGGGMVSKVEVMELEADRLSHLSSNGSDDGMVEISLHTHERL